MFMQDWLKKLIVIVALILTSLTTSAQTSPEEHLPSSFAEQYFINEMVTEYHFNKQKLIQLMKQADYLPQVIQIITKPFEAKPWDFYLRYFLTPARIHNGNNYWKNHFKTLMAAKNEFGVDPNVIIAIIGIESFYGNQAGKFQELGALSTLAFYYPPRSQFFQKELKQYLLLTAQQHLSPLSLTGSYAGALGIPQFMPSSYRNFGIDYSRNHSVDLLHDHDDAIASIANYLKKRGWQIGQPVATRAIITKTVPQKLISATGMPNTTIARLKRFGIKSRYNFPPHQKVALIAMQNEKSVEYWIVFPNFHAIMAYNPRTTYAMAVYLLSKAIERNHERTA